jgi:hypothetical protein
MGTTFGTMDLWNLRFFLTRTVTRGIEEEDTLVNLVSKIDQAIERGNRGIDRGTEHADRLSA